MIVNTENAERRAIERDPQVRREMAEVALAQAQQNLADAIRDAHVDREIELIEQQAAAEAAIRNLDPGRARQGHPFRLLK